MMVFLKPHEEEFKRAFLDPAVLYGPLAECPDCGEVWQYMGTVEKGSGWVHEFRHRHHPDRGTRIVARVPADPNWKPEGKVGPSPEEEGVSPAQQMIEDYMGVRKCDGCGRKAVCIPDFDGEDGSVIFLCGRCSGVGEVE